MEKIDFVIIWVDGNDEQWKKEKAKYSSQKGEDTSDARYRDWDNLKYLFRGIEKFAPWVNRVHFITCGHLPSWLNTNCSKLNIVKHSDYIPKEYLPTFSSHPIELNLHRIKELEENFVYFNDDMFLINKVTPEDFFKKGLPCDEAIMSAIVPSGKGMFEHILVNNMNCINRHFNKNDVIKQNPTKWFHPKYGLAQLRTLLLLAWSNFPGIKFNHLPSSFQKKTFEEVWKNEYEVLNATCQNKFRNPSDVNQWLMKNWQVVTGKFHPRTTRIGKFLTISDKNEEIIKTIKNQKYKMICLNDNEKIEKFEQTKQEINEAFEKILPDKSEFEK